MRYVGVDLGKLECVTAILDAGGEIVDRLKVSNTPEGFAELERRLEAGDELVVEASTYAYPFHDHFVAKGYRVHAAHPGGVRKIAQSESKNDWKDAFDLANLKRTNYFPAAYIPHPDILRLRDVIRAQAELSHESSRCKTRIRSFMARTGTRQPFPRWTLFRPTGLAWLKTVRFSDERDTLWKLRVKELDSILDRRRLLEAQLAKLAVNDRRVQLLMSVPGIDFTLALMLVAEIGDIQRFPTVEGFRFYAGCAPRVRESAGVNRAQGTVQGCSRRLKWALGLAVKTLVLQASNPIQAYYQLQRRRTRSTRRSMARARRKLCDLVRAILLHDEPCRWEVAANVGPKRRRLSRLAKDADDVLDRPRVPGAT